MCAAHKQNFCKSYFFVINKATTMVSTRMHMVCNYRTSKALDPAYLLVIALWPVHY